MFACTSSLYLVPGPALDKSDIIINDSDVCASSRNKSTPTESFEKCSQVFFAGELPVRIKYTLLSLLKSLIVGALQTADTNPEDKYRQKVVGLNLRPGISGMPRPAPVHRGPISSDS